MQCGSAKLADVCFADYFIFQKNILHWNKDLIIGRDAYDNAIIAHVLRSNRLPLVDFTKRIKVAHQFHDYGHVKGGISAVYSGCDSRINRENYECRIMNAELGIPS